MNFSRHEFACKDRCGFADIEYTHVSMLQAMRTDLGRAIHTTSGCRCKIHNKRVGGKDNSEHLVGEGTDHEFENTLELFEFIEAAIKAGFRRIGIDFEKMFVHLGSSKDHHKPRLWGYSTKEV